MASLFRMVLALTVLVLTFWMAGVMKKDERTLLQLLDAKVGMEAFQPVHDRLFGAGSIKPPAKDGIDQAIDQAERKRKNAGKNEASAKKSTAKPTPTAVKEQTGTPSKADPPSPGPTPPAAITKEDQRALDDLINQVAP